MTTRCLGWIDLATTGIKPDDQILGVAAAVTDCDFNLVAVRYYPIAVTDLPDEVPSRVIEGHTANGVLQQTQQSEIAQALGDATVRIVSFFQDNECVIRDVDWYTPLCGYGVGFDRLFLKAQMSKLNSLFDLCEFDTKALFNVMQIDARAASKPFLHPEQVLKESIRLCQENLK